MPVIEVMVTAKVSAGIVNQMKGITVGLAVCITIQNNVLQGTENVNYIQICWKEML